MRRRIAVAVLGILVGAVLAGAQQSGDELPDLENTGVVVPWEDFKLILEEIRRPQPTPVAPPPPVDLALSECVASATVSADQKQVRVNLSFAVQVLNDQHWVEVPVIGEGVALASVRLDGAPARMYRKNGFHTIALRAAGQHRMTLEYLLPVYDSRGTRTARLKFPRAPVVTIDLRVPRGDVDLQVDGAVVQNLNRSATETRVRAALSQVGDTAVSWFKRVDTEERESKIFGELATLVSIGEGVLRGVTNATFTIHGRGVDRFRLEIPADITVLGVNVHGLDGWEVVEIDGETDRRLLVVELSYLAQGSLGFSFDFEQPLEGASAELELPDIALRDVLRERGFLAVAAATNVEITPREGLENAAPIDPSELPPALVAGNSEAVLYGFKFLRHPVVVPLKVVKHRDVAVKRTMVEAARLHTFLNRQGKLVTSARYTVKNNRKQYLEMELPQGATLWGAYLEGQPVKAARREDGATLVPMRKTVVDAAGQLRSFTVEVVYFEDGRRLSALGRRAFRAPSLDVDVLELSWDFYLPRERRYFGFRGNLEEDRAANRIVLVGGAAYNLAVGADLRLLDLEHREGGAYLTDGVNETPVGDVKVQAAGKQRSLSSEELAEIGKQKRAELDGLDTDDESGAEEEKLVLGDPRSMMDRPSPQVQANVARDVGALQRVAGGRALGMLPVKVKVPTDGLRLSFTGRLLTSEETAELRLGYAPAGWRLPKLGRWWTALLAFAFGLAALFFFGFGSNEDRRANWLAVAVSAAALVAVFVVSGGHRVTFILACGAALAAYALLAQLRERPHAGGSF